MIVGQNSLLNQYVPVFYIKDLRDGQGVIYDSVRKAFVNADVGGGSGGATRLGDLLDVSPSVDNPLSLQNGQALVYNTFTSLWENKFIDYNTLLNKPTNTNSFIGLTDTATPSLPNGYVHWNSAGTQLVYDTTIPASSITGLATVATTGNYNDLVTKLSAPVNQVLYGTGSGVTSSSTLTYDSGTSTMTVGGTASAGLISSDPAQPLTVESDVSLTFRTGSVNRLIINTNGSFSIAGSAGTSGYVLTSTGASTSPTWQPASGGGTGTVQSFAFTNANGITGIVTNPTTTPTLSLSLGAITPSSVTSTGTISGTNFTGTSSGTNTGDQTITLTGDITGSGTGSFVTTLANTTVVPGSYTLSNITVDSKGRITSISSGSAGGTGTVTSVTVNGTAGNITSSGSPITTSGAITLNLATTTVTPGTYTHSTITVDSFGRITSASSGSAGVGTVTSVGVSGANGIGVSGSPITTSGVIALSLGAITPTSVSASGTVTGSNLSGTNTGNQIITLSGDATNSNTSTGGVLTLATVNGNVGTFGSATQVPVVTVDAKGRITAVTNVAITGGGTVTSTSVTPTADITGSVATPTTTPAISLALTATGVAASTYGSSTQVPVFTVDAKGRISGVTNTTISAGSITPEVVVFHYSSGGAGNFTPVDAIFSQTSGVTATVTDGANCIATYAFTGKANPPKSIMFYGQNFVANTFAIVNGAAAYGAALANIKIAGGGTSASPDLANGIFSATNLITLQSRMSDTGASSTIGNRAWLVVVFGF